MKLFVRIRVRKAGQFYHCRFFTSGDGLAHALNGTLVFDEREWPEMKRRFAMMGEVIEEDTLVE